VKEVLNSSGHPLDADTRNFFASHFDHDFAMVRVHTDARAAESARAVNALAYTVGKDIVFGSGSYAPTTNYGQRLLAHELTHVLQQAGGTKSTQQELEIGSSDDHLERQAEGSEVALWLRSAHDPVRTGSVQPRVQRQKGDPVDVELVPTSSEEQKRLERLGIHLPTVSPETWRDIGGVSDNAGTTLSENEKQKIAQITKTGAPAAQKLSFTNGPQFVLHDTAATTKATRLQELKSLGRGPLGEGAAGYVPAVGEPVQARSFFEQKRPTATEFERGQDILKKASREKEYRSVWTTSKVSERQPALDRALDGLNLKPQEIAKEQNDARAQLSAGSGEVRTTASWAATEICSRAQAAGAKAIAASPSTQTQLEASCSTLAPLLSARKARVGSMLNVEIVLQPGSDCRTSGKLEALPQPVYTADQHRGLVKLYLMAALQAGKFPEVTTHFWVDRVAGDHCDPRCFDLMHLYNLIAAALGHGQGSTYGIKPNYGTKQGTNNVWWHETVCGGRPPKV